MLRFRVNRRVQERVSNVVGFFHGFLCVVSQGREDQAEETLLRLIRDPYNLGDASWTPESVAETAEWRRLEVKLVLFARFLFLVFWIFETFS